MTQPDQKSADTDAVYLTVRHKKKTIMFFCKESDSVHRVKVLYSISSTFLTRRLTLCISFPSRQLLLHWWRPVRKIKSCTTEQQCWMMNERCKIAVSIRVMPKLSSLWNCHCLYGRKVNTSKMSILCHTLLLLHCRMWWKNIRTNLLSLDYFLKMLPVISQSPLVIYHLNVEFGTVIFWLISRSSPNFNYNIMWDQKFY